MYKFGNYICKLREEKNLTQTELADKLDVSDKSISKWENGQAFPRMETFEKLAFALDTTIEDILSASKYNLSKSTLYCGESALTDLAAQLYRCIRYFISFIFKKIK